jgi:hypothetical protein
MVSLSAIDDLELRKPSKGDFFELLRRKWAPHRKLRQRALELMIAMGKETARDLKSKTQGCVNDHENPWVKERENPQPTRQKLSRIERLPSKWTQNQSKLLLRLRLRVLSHP